MATSLLTMDFKSDLGCILLFGEPAYAGFELNDDFET